MCLQSVVIVAGFKQSINVAASAVSLQQMDVLERSSYS